MIEKECVAVSEILVDSYIKYGELFINTSISIALKTIARMSYDEYAYGTYSYCNIDGRKPTLEEMDLHRKYNDTKYGDYAIHDYLNKLRQNSSPHDFLQADDKDFNDMETLVNKLINDLIGQ